MLDAAIALRREIDAFLKQRVDEPSMVDEADAQLLGLAGELTRRMPVAGEVLDGPAGDADGGPRTAGAGRWRGPCRAGDPGPPAPRLRSRHLGQPSTRA